MNVDASRHRPWIPIVSGMLMMIQGERRFPLRKWDYCAVEDRWGRSRCWRLRDAFNRRQCQDATVAWEYLQGIPVLRDNFANLRSGAVNYRDGEQYRVAQYSVRANICVQDGPRGMGAGLMNSEDFFGQLLCCRLHGNSVFSRLFCCGSGWLFFENIAVHRFVCEIQLILDYFKLL